MFLLKPAEKTGEGRKLARAYHGRYRVVKLADNNAHIRRVDRPESNLLLVAIDRLRRCPDEILDNQFWPPDKSKRPPTQTKPRDASTGGTLDWKVKETLARGSRLNQGGNVMN